MNPKGNFVKALFRSAIGAALCIAGCLSTAAQQYKILHTFTANFTDGAIPYGTLVRDAAGNLYGTASQGGTAGRGTNGVIYKIDPVGNETVLYSFIKPEGVNPYSRLILDGAGNLYGTNSNGGWCCGTVFELFPSGKLKLLHRFGVGTSWDGADPYAGVVVDAEGNLYGTTIYGGSSGQDYGAVYKIDPAGTETVVHSFTGEPDGAYPNGDLVIDSQGNIFGTTQIGGIYADYGTIFKIDPSGNETVLYSFAGGLEDGRYPSSGLIEGANGVLYGTVYEGGIYGYGAIFEFDQSTSTFSLIYSFDGSSGGFPLAGLTRDRAGNFYGTTYEGADLGVVYKLQANGIFTVLHYFGTRNADGYNPYAGVILDEQGNVYGTTKYGGDPVCNCGVVFKITP